MSKRKIKRNLLFAVTIVCFSFCVQHVFAQAPEVKTFIDKNSILIGEQIQYKVVATFPNGAFKVDWLNMPDSVAHFEVVDRGKVDTSTANNTTVIQQTITLTSFDSGRWNTPAFTIRFNPVNAAAVNVFTDSIPVNVGYAPADTSGQLRDIKPIMEVTIQSYFWYYVAGIILLLLILAFVLWHYFTRKKPTTLPAFASKTSPYDEAMQSLDKLSKLNLQNPDDIKQYHAGIATAFKWYISRKQHNSIMNKTTGDVLVFLTDNNLSAETIAVVATALRCGDAVKFARFLPATAESEDCLAKIKSTINLLQQSNTNNKQ